MSKTTPAAVRPAGERARAMPRSAIREIMSLAAERKDVIHLEIGEPDATTPLPIIEAAFAAARDGATRYSSNAGLPHLRQLAAARIAGRWGCAVGADRVVITTGAVGALFSALMCVLDAGDEVLVPDPGWPNYESIAHLAGARMVRYPMPAHDGFVPSIDAIAARVTPRTKALMINSPCNPTGAMFSAALMRQIGELCLATGIYLISDEIYEDIVFDAPHVSAGTLGLDDRVFVIGGVSKSFAMTGWRVGWLVCPPALASVAIGLQEPVTSCVSTVSQKAAEAALEGPQDSVMAFRDMFRRRRGVLCDVFGGTSLLPLTPAGAFYALIDISPSGLGSLELAKRLLIERNVATVPGITFGPECDRYVRVAFTQADAVLHEGLRRLRQYIEAGVQ